MCRTSEPSSALVCATTRAPPAATRALSSEASELQQQQRAGALRAERLERKEKKREETRRAVRMCTCTCVESVELLNGGHSGTYASSEAPIAGASASAGAGAGASACAPVPVPVNHFQPFQATASCMRPRNRQSRRLRAVCRVLALVSRAAVRVRLQSAEAERRGDGTV